ncbi:MAG: S8 family peptidase [Planctomycetaceae bacterium]|nr:S8 family peptidase [Planctomycetaceae bacterium]
MGPLRHLFPQKTASTEAYTYPRIVVSTEFKTPPRDGRVKHATSLIAQLQAAETMAEQQTAGLPEEEKPKGVTLDFSSDPAFKLQLEALDIRRSGIELCSSRMDGEVMHATVFVPDGKLGIFVRTFERYQTEDDKRSGKPKRQKLVESITQIKLAVLQSFWTDAGAFPPETDNPQWWEIWIRDQTNPHDVTEAFREAAASVGVDVSSREIRFPERRVVLAHATASQLMSVPNLFDILAEIREAKAIPTTFVEMQPREQQQAVEAALERITPPNADAPAVCHLDTGVHRGHPLLEASLAPEDALACHPEWTATDTHPQQHGTGMAGLGLYGCLTSLFTSGAPLPLRHRLESVKILEWSSPNDPDLYGDVTDEAIGRIEVVNPNRKRAFCLTVTADGRDEGFPSSWSAALDKTCAGTDDDERRLLFVSAGNVPLEERHEYPGRNQVSGVEDPSQSWNAVSVGAYTEKAVIQSEDYSDWQPIAEPGGLSPSSRTSVIWAEKSWPLKPDFVMEGGNNAIDPATRLADHIDDLSLLTTRLSPTGSLLTTTGETSAATALAARSAAIIYSHYSDLRPETVRGLLVHSARWTERMIEEFPTKRHDRLRCYGYGVPNLEVALWSASNAVTMIIESELQPFDKVGSNVKTKEMHLHQLPWPIQVLENLGHTDVKMRVTLSYFVEPNPGRRGWTRKHRYQSHGLRFEIKHPLESDSDFHKRISREAWEEDEESGSISDDRKWEIGKQLRSKGSVHSDCWTGTAAELAACGVLAVYPVTGWWKERKHLDRWNRQARYSLIVTIETPEVNVDLYTPIATQIGVPVETVIET